MALRRDRSIEEGIRLFFPLIQLDSNTIGVWSWDVNIFLVIFKCKEKYYF